MSYPVPKIHVLPPFDVFLNSFDVPAKRNERMVLRKARKCVAHTHCQCVHSRSGWCPMEYWYNRGFFNQGPHKAQYSVDQILAFRFDVPYVADDRYQLASYAQDLLQRSSVGHQRGHLFEQCNDGLAGRDGVVGLAHINIVGVYSTSRVQGNRGSAVGVIEHRTPQSCRPDLESAKMLSCSVCRIEMIYITGW